MGRRRRALVLYGAYLGAGGTFLGVVPVAAVTVAVFAASALASYYAERRVGPVVRRFGGNR